MEKQIEGKNRQMKKLKRNWNKNFNKIIKKNYKKNNWTKIIIWEKSLKKIERVDKDKKNKNETKKK